LTSWPLIYRELRVLARQGQLFWIRIAGGAAGFATLSFLLLQEVVVGAALGDRLFTALNAMLFLTILFIGPLVTCDCIAQEKREGTLGLLFLAPISERTIILSKLTVNAVRAFSLLMALLPMMALPVVFGGVDSSKLLWAISLQITAMSVALSAGVLSSTLHRSFIQAAVVAEICCLALAAVCVFFLPWSTLIACVAGLMSTVIVVEYCSGRLKSKWEEESAEHPDPLWVRVFSESASWRLFFHWDTQRARSRNPIAWLQEYSWTARLAKWGWLALVAVTEFFLICTALVEQRGTDRPQLLLAGLVLLGISMAGANSFRRERLSGAMELLLVTPLSPLQIILGRLWGIWVHFLPAVSTLSIIWIMAGGYLHVNAAEGYVIIASYLFIPMIGLYVSLFPWNVLVDCGVIFITGAVLPIYCGGMLRSIPAAILIQAVTGVVALSLLYIKLQRRSFTLTPA
jgi:ABC-type transport system involved in multi-copper enzyme maturation permease subunit